MQIGGSLAATRKKSGLSQEEVAEKLGVSRQTISKWETGETIPDLVQSKKLAALYHLSLDELIAFDLDVKELEEVIQRTTEEQQKKVDWNKLWSQKYPVLGTYRHTVETQEYQDALGALLERLQREYRYNKLDAFLVLKDILGAMWKGQEE